MSKHTNTEREKHTNTQTHKHTHTHTHNVNLPWFTNSGVLLVLPAPWVSSGLFDVLNDEKLFWDWIALLSISTVLVLQKSSDTLFFLTGRPWILSPFDGSSTATVNLGWLQLPRQPLLCYKLGLSNHKNWLVPSPTWFHSRSHNCMTNCKKQHKWNQACRQKFFWNTLCPERKKIRKQ